MFSKGGNCTCVQFTPIRGYLPHRSCLPGALEAHCWGDQEKAPGLCGGRSSRPHTEPDLPGPELLSEGRRQSLEGLNLNKKRALSCCHSAFASYLWHFAPLCWDSQQPLAGLLTLPGWPSQDSPVEAHTAGSLNTGFLQAADRETHTCDKK